MLQNGNISFSTTDSSVLPPIEQNEASPLGPGTDQIKVPISSLETVPVNTTSFCSETDEVKVPPTSSDTGHVEVPPPCSETSQVKFPPPIPAKDEVFLSCSESKEFKIRTQPFQKRIEYTKVNALEIPQ